MASSSRVFILLGLMLTIVLLISSSEVTTARDLAAAAQTETKEATAKTNGVKESKNGRFGSDSGGCRGQYCGKKLCCTDEAEDVQTSTEPQN